jgi:GNAT superfamily N-acetyltransferase
MSNEIKTTYLELNSSEDFMPKRDYMAKMQIRKVENSFFLNFMLFIGVGSPWHWYSRLMWTLEEWESYFERNDVMTFLGFVEDKLVGYFEIEFDEQEEAELKFIGLLPEYLGYGYGGVILSHAVDMAFISGVTRLWLHTCNRDHPAAIDNYLARGFRIYKEVWGEEEVPEEKEFLSRINDLLRQYYKRFSDLGTL